MDQLGFYATTVPAIGITLRWGWRSWNATKALEMQRLGLDVIETDKFGFHFHASGLPSVERLDSGLVYQRYASMRAFAAVSFLFGAFTAFVQLKNRNRPRN